MAPVDTGSVGRDDLGAESGLRDRKKLATRNAIREATFRLVAERGFARVTVEEIAAAAEIAPRTFFNYFPSKESVVFGDAQDTTDRLARSFLARPADETPIAALRAVLMEHGSMMLELGDEPSIWQQHLSIVRNDPALLGPYVAHNVKMERRLIEAVAQRLKTDPSVDPYPALLTATMLAATRVAALHWSAGDGSQSLPHLTAIALDSVASGLQDVQAFVRPTRRSSARKHPSPSEKDVSATKGSGVTQ
jgi:AcrR family transcriptional regulator